MENKQIILQQKMDQLKEEFRQALPVKINQISSTWCSLRDGNMGVETLNDLLALVHKMAGSAGIFGFWHVSEIAEEIEINLQKLTKLKNIKSSKNIQRIDGLITSLKKIDLDHQN